MFDLKLLLKKKGNKAEAKGTRTSRPAVNLPPPPPPPQVSDSALKPIPDLKKKRPIEPKEREVVLPPKAKQQKVGKDHSSKRASSVESREEPPMADVHRGQRTWSPRLELDGVPFSWETSVKNYDGGRAGLIAEALEQPLLLPRDMESYRRFSQYDLFMSLKKDLAMVFVAEEWNRKAYVEAQAEAHARSEAERALGSLKDEVSQISDQLKGVTHERDSFHAGLRNDETQAEAQHKLLNEAQRNLATEKELVKEFRAKLLKAKEAAKEARRDVQLAKEATEAEKKASYQLGVETTEKGLTEQFASVARDYCDMTWGKALDAAGVPANSELRLPENIFYDEDIRQLPEADAPPPTQLLEVSEQPLVNPAPPVILEPTKDSNPLGDQAPLIEPQQEKGEVLEGKKTPSDPQDQAPTKT
nr:GRB10-interacting GYF protein 2-like [Quercus suber]